MTIQHLKMSFEWIRAPNAVSRAANKEHRCFRTAEPGEWEREQWQRGFLLWEQVWCEKKETEEINVYLKLMYAWNVACFPRSLSGLRNSCSIWKPSVLLLICLWVFLLLLSYVLCQFKAWAFFSFSVGSLNSYVCVCLCVCICIYVYSLKLEIIFSIDYKEVAGFCILFFPSLLFAWLSALFGCYSSV